MKHVICVIGAGVMGKGIAKSFAKYENLQVILYDQVLIDDENILNSNIKCTNNFSDVVSANIIIEAIYENYDAKVNLYQNLEEIISDNAIICSNTSSISINKLANTLSKKERFLGVHFMNPADRNELVELIPSDYSNNETINVISDLLAFIGKIPIVVKDSPGFIVNRILIPMINDAINVFDSGIATKESIDMSMKIAAKHPIGPLALADLIGLDVVLNIMENLYNTFNDEKYKPASLLYTMVNENRIGKKVKNGFYEYKKIK